MDVFICFYELRKGLQEKTLDSWKKIAQETKAIQIHCLMTKNLIQHLNGPTLILDEPLSEFQRGRRIFAEVMSRTPYYVLADDDVTTDSDSLLLALGLLADEKYKDFAALSLMPSNAHIYPWTPENYTPVLDDQVMEHESAGLIRVTRKGCMPEDENLWLPQPEATPFGFKYDGPYAEQVRARGFRVGYALQSSCVHLGERSWRLNGATC